MSVITSSNCDYQVYISGEDISAENILRWIIPSAEDITSRIFSGGYSFKNYLRWIIPSAEDITLKNIQGRIFRQE